MKVLYDPDRDILQITFIDTTVEETSQIAPGLILDYDVDGNVIGVELRNALSKVDTPYEMAYLVGRANLDKPQIDLDLALAAVRSQSFAQDSPPTKSAT